MGTKTVNRITSNNLNKRLNNDKYRKLTEQWLEKKDPDLVLFQEPWVHKQAEPVPLEDYNFIGGNSDVAIYCAKRSNIDLQSISSTFYEERWMSVEVDQVVVHNLYFPSGKSSERRELLDRIRIKLNGEEAKNHILLGDFNFAPCEEDGLYDGKISKWTTTEERLAYQKLLSTINLVDVHPRDDVFTLDRLIHGKRSQFRCDLALISTNILISCSPIITFDHNTRKGDFSFTDHSGVICDLLN